MTHREFTLWRKREFPSRLACATAMGWGRDKVDALETGKTRGGARCSIRTADALACAAWTVGIREFHGETDESLWWPKPLGKRRSE